MITFGTFNIWQYTSHTGLTYYITYIHSEFRVKEAHRIYNEPDVFIDTTISLFTQLQAFQTIQGFLICFVRRESFAHT